MKQYKGPRRAKRAAIFWITTGRLLGVSSAFFLHDLRISKPPPRRNLCEEQSCCSNTVVMNPMQRRLPTQRLTPLTNEIQGDESNSKSFESISTRIYMVGPLMDDGDCGLVGECFGASFPRSRQSLAQGILCPETVTKMEMVTQGGRSNRAVKAFLDRYHTHGPMSCMDLLSDPEILPHLTITMRNLL